MKYFLLSLFTLLNLNAFEAFVKPNELKEHLQKKNLILIDVASKELYQQGHILNALHCDVSKLINTTKLYPLIHQSSAIQKELSQFGINYDSDVVIYSHNTDKGLQASTLLALVLISHGFNSVSILDGGYMAWIFENELLVSTQVNNHPNEGNFQLKRRDDILVNYEYVEKNLKSIPIIDSRSEQHYYGIKRSSKTETIGHISHAKSNYYKNSFLTDGLLRDKKELDEMFIEGSALQKGKEVIIYSDTILSASVNWYILYQHMGFKKSKIYEASFYEWGNYSELPLTRFKWE